MYSCFDICNMMYISGGYIEELLISSMTGKAGPSSLLAQLLFIVNVLVLNSA